MHKTFPMWHDHVVTRHIMSVKETYLQGTYDGATHRLTGADIFEQVTRLFPEKSSDKPVLTGNASLAEVPLTFAQSGGYHWHIRADYCAAGCKIVFDARQSLVRLEEVTFEVSYDYTTDELRRHHLKHTGRNLPFKAWNELKCQVLLGGRTTEIIPVYLVPEKTVSVEIVGHAPVYTLAGGTKVKPYFVGGNICSLHGLTHFRPAEKLPAEVRKLF